VDGLKVWVESEVFAMENPKIRPGLVEHTEPMARVIAFFRNAAMGNLAIQLLTGMGIPSDRLGVTPPEEIEGRQGMVLDIGCPDEALVRKVETLCRDYGAEIHRRRR
jgi:hypothetical protein